MVTHNEEDPRCEQMFATAGSGSADPELCAQALEMLKLTSRTFYIPIVRLPGGLLQAVGSAYLCLRAIDEIEDHPSLTAELKARLLRNTSRVIQSSDERLRLEDFLICQEEFREMLPQVTVRLPDWLALAPRSIAHRIWDATAAMADRMADWAAEGFQILSESDLDRYTMGVAGAVGLILSDLWAWHGGVQTDRCNAVGFGRGLQAVNILRNREEDQERGVSFYPPGWGTDQMQAYARKNLILAKRYLDELPPGPALDFCSTPYKLAYATIEAIADGRPKLERAEVMRLLGMA